MNPNEPAPPRPRRADGAGQWYLVAVLTAIYMLKFVDSAVVNVVVNPIKADLGISDVQMSVLLGLAFVSLYALLSVPAGYVVDTVSRRLLLAVSVLFWSLMAALTGFAGIYWQFFACRVGLGMGEAALQPAALSLMKDGVSPDRRGRAFSVYQAGLTLGGGAGALVGGALFSLGASGGLSNWPILGHMKPWQLVIALPGLFGILVSPLLLTIHEPRRTHSQGVTRAGGFGEAFSYIGRHWRLYLPIFGGETAVSMAAGGAWNAWLVAAIGRTWGLSPAPIAQTIGSMQLILFPAAASCSVG
jgi:MFS family permease